MTPADSPSPPINGLNPAARRTTGRRAMIAISLCVAMGLGGCQTVKWSKPGGTEAMFQSDQYQCVQESISQLPPAYATQYPAYQGYSSQSKCKPKSGGYLRLRWSPVTGQFGGKNKLGSDVVHAADF
jgi:hypothetical protein